MAERMGLPRTHARKLQPSFRDLRHVEIGRHAHGRAWRLNQVHTIHIVYAGKTLHLVPGHFLRGRGLRGRSAIGLANWAIAIHRNDGLRNMSGNERSVHGPGNLNVGPTHLLQQSFNAVSVEVDLKSCFTIDLDFLWRAEIAQGANGKPAN